MFLLPNLLGFTVFFVLPLAAAVALSLCRWNMLSPPEFVGLANYRHLLDDPMFWRSMANTLQFALLSIPLSVAGSLALALALDRSVRGIAFFRAVFFLPSVCSIVAISVLWQWLYDKDQGLINAALSAIAGGVLSVVAPLARLAGIAVPERVAVGIDWLGDPAWAMPSVVASTVWSSLGYNSLVFLAALQDIPAELHEAASLDGAGRWARFRHVTLPGLGHATYFVTVVSIIGAFQAFDSVYVMTRGGPAGATTTAVYYVFSNAFAWFKMGYACALAMVLFALIVSVTGLYHLTKGADEV
jgi:multiple sugar transport system permease protein